MKKQNCVYMLKCSDGTLYTGWTNDIEKRFTAHQNGVGAKYTKVRRPLELVYVEVCEDKSTGMKREYAIKKMTRNDKIRLIEKREKIY